MSLVPGQSDSSLPSKQSSSPSQTNDWDIQSTGETHLNSSSLRHTTIAPTFRIVKRQKTRQKNLDNYVITWCITRKMKSWKTLGPHLLPHRNQQSHLQPNSKVCRLRINHIETLSCHCRCNQVHQLRSNSPPSRCKISQNSNIERSAIQDIFSYMTSYLSGNQ